MRKIFPYLCFLTVIVFASCRHDDFIESADVQLRFSEDTLIFDTVFASVGSVTLVMQVYNDYSSAVRISSLRLANGNSSYFRLNVDGQPGRTFTDVEIPANDSIFIFCEVTIDPNNVSTPFVVTDSVVFTTNGNQQDVDLVAWGQNAHFHRPAAGSNAFVIPCNDVWIDDLPHVIYGYALVYDSCTLTIEKGTNIFLHPGSSIIVMTYATLTVNGEKDSVVTFTGDRLGEDYREIPGQWGAIQLSNLSQYNLNGSSTIYGGSRNNKINYAVIKNGNIGLLVDTVSGSDTTLILTNTIIENMAGSCLVGRGSRIRGGNCVFANASQYVAALAYGGSYDFRHCTFANFWNYSDRTTPVLFINNYIPGSGRAIDNAYFGNCIMYGDKSEEIVLDSSTSAPAAFNFFFKNSLLQVGGAFSTNSSRFDSCVVNQNPKFKNPDVNNYQLDTLSNAKNKGSMSVINQLYLERDLKDFDRINAFPPPDCGAYERPD